MVGQQDSAGMEEDADRFFELVDALRTDRPDLTPIEAAILVAAEQGIASDSRTFARKMGLAHALVLREVDTLVEDRGLLQIVKRDARTMRIFYSAT